MLIRAITCVIFIGLSAGGAFANATPDLAVDGLNDELIAIAPSQPPEAENSIEGNVAVLQGLNKVTGHTSKLEGPIGTVMRFGTLEIIPRRCWKASPEERPENAALLEIRELKPDEGPQNIFLGWMFSSSPGLSGLENAVYDVNVISCESVSDPEKNDTATATATTQKAQPAKKKHNSSQ